MRQTEVDSAGCRYPTPVGRCGDAGAYVTVAGFRIVVCPDHAETTLEGDSLSGEAA